MRNIYNAAQGIWELKELLGIEINNPGYIEDQVFAALQEGYLGVRNGFAVFDTMANGVAAAGAYLKYLHETYSLKDIRSLISNETLGWYRKALGYAEENINELVSRIVSATGIRSLQTLDNITPQFAANFMLELFYFMNEDDVIPMAIEHIQGMINAAVTRVEDRINTAIDMAESIVGRVQRFLQDPVGAALERFPLIPQVIDAVDNIQWSEEQDELVDPDAYLREYAPDLVTSRETQNRNTEEAITNRYGGKERLPRGVLKGADIMGAASVPAPVNWENPDDPVTELIVRPDGETVPLPGNAADAFAPPEYTELPVEPQDVNTGSCAVGGSTDSPYAGDIASEDNRWRPGMPLSGHFNIEDMTTGRANPHLNNKIIPSLPAQFISGGETEIGNLKETARNVLEPLFGMFGAALIVRRGWAEGERGSIPEKHFTGEAVAVQVAGFERAMTAPLMRMRERGGGTGYGLPVQGSQTGRTFDDVPRSGGAVNSRSFGGPRGTSQLHSGVDIPGAVGDPVIAIADGVIRRADNSNPGGYGLTVDIEYPDGTVHRNAHLGSLGNFQIGQNVAAGTVLGTVGYTGNAGASFPHVHYEVIRGDYYNATGGARVGRATTEGELLEGRMDPREYYADTGAATGRTVASTFGIQLHIDPIDGGQQDQYVLFGKGIQEGTFIRGQFSGPLPANVHDAYVPSAQGAGTIS